MPADSRAYPVVEEGQAGSILQAVDATRVRGVNSTDSTGTDPRIVGPFRQLSLAEAKINVPLERAPERFRPNDVPLMVGDRSRIETELGWIPQVPIEQTLRDILEDWRTRTRADA